MRIQYKNTENTPQIFDLLDENIAEYEADGDVERLLLKLPDDTRGVDRVLMQREYCFRLGELLWQNSAFDILASLHDAMQTYYHQQLLLLPMLNDMVGSPKILTAAELQQLPLTVQGYSCCYWLQDAGSRSNWAKCFDGPDDQVLEKDIDSELAVRPVITIPNIDLFIKARAANKRLEEFWIGSFVAIAIGSDRLLFNNFMYPIAHIFDNRSNDYNNSSLKEYVDSGKFMRDALKNSAYIQMEISYK